jgi:UTP--glucose-1-phosphate uridylyltransferase
MNQMNNLVKKAIIPAAGFGTRMFPASQEMKKEFFPIIDRDGRAKPILLLIIEEALEAGIEEIGIVIQPGDQQLFESFFKRPPKAELWQKLSEEKQAYSQYLQEIGQKITFLIQHQQEGYVMRFFVGKNG